MSRLSTEPLLPPGLWLALALAMAALLAWYALSRPAGISRARWRVIIGLMALGAAAVLVLLLNPTRIVPLPPPPGRPLLSILVDGSASMRSLDGGGRRSRAAVAVEEAVRLEALRDSFDLDVRVFDAASRAATLEQLRDDAPSGDVTDLAQAITSCLTADRAAGQAILVLSDGIHNAEVNAGGVLEAARIARALDVPIYTRTIGEGATLTDLALDLRSAQDLAIRHQRVPITARVRYHGKTPVETFVRLFREDREIARKPVSLRAGWDDAEVHFVASSDSVGVFRHHVSVDALPQEDVGANNRAPYVLRVVNEPIRVLVLEGKPYWDTKFLLGTLAADQAVAVDAMVKVRPDRVIRRVLSHADPAGAHSGAPARTETSEVLAGVDRLLGEPEMLQPYQVVVVGREAESFLGDAAIDALRQWIGGGGALVCYRGSPTSLVNEELRRLLPVRWTPSPESRFRVELTRQGRDMHWSLDAAGGDETVTGRMPSLAAAALPESNTPLAVVLATATGPDGAGRPVVTYHQYGSGRVVVIEGSGMWRWSFLPPAFKRDAGVYASLWQSLLRWLTSGSGLLRGQKFNLRADKVTFDTGEQATATLIARSEGPVDSLPAVLLRRAGDTSVQRFRPVPIGPEVGAYRISFGELAEGRYAGEIEGCSGDDASSVVAFEVRRYGREMLDLQPRPDLMARVSRTSGGAAVSDPARQLRTLVRAHRETSRPESAERDPAWDRGRVMLGVLALWTACWIVRRRGGLT